MGLFSKDDYRVRYFIDQTGGYPPGMGHDEYDQIVTGMIEGNRIKSFAKKIGLRPIAQWKPLGIEMAGLNSGETVVPGYTSEGSIGFEMGGEAVKVGFDFYGRVAVNGQNKFAMSGGERFTVSIDKYYGALLAGFRTDGTLNSETVLPDSSARFGLEGGAELGRRSDGLIPSLTAGALWNAGDQRLASTYLMLGYDW